MIKQRIEATTAKSREKIQQKRTKKIIESKIKRHHWMTFIQPFKLATIRNKSSTTFHCFTNIILSSITISFIVHLFLIEPYKILKQNSNRATHVHNLVRF